MSEGKLVREVRKKARAKQSQTNEILERQAQRLPKQSFQDLKFTNPVAFNIRAEEKFIELVRTLLAEQPETGTYPIWAVYQEASYEIQISTETAKRYLTRHSARRAEFHVFGKLVMLNPNYVPADGEEEQQEAPE